MPAGVHEHANEPGLSSPLAHPSRTQRAVSPNRGSPVHLVCSSAPPGPVVPVPLCLLSLSRAAPSVQFSHLLCMPVQPASSPSLPHVFAEIQTHTKPTLHVFRFFICTWLVGQMALIVYSSFVSRDIRTGNTLGDRLRLPRVVGHS